MAIARRVAQCVDIFQQVSHVFGSKAGNETDETLPTQFGEEFGRFKVWSSNIGAHQTGPSSLDYRLRESKTLQIRVSELLDSLKESLERGESV